MIVTIQKVSQESGDFGEYVKVTGVKPDGAEATKNVSDKFRDKWPLLQAGNTVDLKMTQRNNKWQISDISLAGSQLPASQDKGKLLAEDQKIIDEVLRKEPAPQAVGMITKELGDHIRAGTLTQVFGKKIGIELTKWYRSQTLGITRIPYDGKDLPQYKED